MTEATDWVYEQVQQRTSTDGQLWTARRTILNQAKKDDRKDRLSVDLDAVQTVLDHPSRNGLVYWHGLLAPATDEHLQALLQEEVESDITRSILVGRLNQRRQEVTA